MQIFRVIGLMSGTSLDGIDAALIRTDGERFIEREAFLSVPYDDALRARLRASLNAPVETARAAEADLTRAHADVVLRLIADKGIKASDVDLIGFHGQTVAHAPEKKFTCQIGDGALLARLTGIRVVNDFRTADVHAGGQGAPLVPVYHRALAEKIEKPMAFLNIGGVANVTFIGRGGEVIAFDTGPGNALIDDWVLQKSGNKYDDGGRLALQGVVHQDVLDTLMAHPFFARKPPKSLDRNAFVSGMWENLSAVDGAATLTAFTAQSVARALEFLPEKPKMWVVAGGGRLNDALMDGLKKHLGVAVRAIEDFNLNGDAIEAEAFAYMAVRSFNGLPISFPQTTGVPQPMVGGRLHQVA